MLVGAFAVCCAVVYQCGRAVMVLDRLGGYRRMLALKEREGILDGGRREGL